MDEIAYLRMDTDVAALKDSILNKDCFQPSPVTVSFDEPPFIDDTCDGVKQQAVIDYSIPYFALVAQRSLEACVLQLLEDQC